MRKRFWKIEYSITIFVIFAIVLLLIPSKFMASKEATYISQWNETFTKMDYIFTAMNAQADADIIKSFKHAKSNEEREQLMMNLVKPYLRISEQDELTKKYNQYYLNGSKVKASDEFYFDNLYLTSKNKIVGIKDIKDEKYRLLLNKEYKFCIDNFERIQKKANKIYEMVITNRKQKLTDNSCSFSILEQGYQEYVENVLR